MSLPQLSIPTADDGVIDANDIRLGVYVIITQSLNAGRGDTITLYWGASSYTLTIENPDHDFPVVLNIDPKDLQTEGYLNVFYEVIDPAQNPSLSEVIEVFICKNCSPPQTLPPLYIQHAEEDNWLNKQEVTGDNGVVLYINPNPVFNISDQITFSWQEKHADGTPVIGSSVTTTLTLTEQNIGQRLQALIPLDKAMLASEGVMTGRYTLLTASGSVSFSDVVSAGFNFGSDNMLPPPLIRNKDSKGQVSTEDILRNQGIIITVPASDLLQAGDELNIYWQGFSSDGGQLPLTLFHVKTRYSGSGDTDVHIPVEYIAPITHGSGQAYYSVTRDEKIDVSPNDSALIAYTRDCELKDPAISFAIDHELTYAQISQSGGVELNIQGGGLPAGDTLNIYSSAYDPDGMYIPALFFSAQHALSNEDIASGFTFLIPESYYTPDPGYHYSLEISPESQPACGALNYFTLANESVPVGDNLHVSPGYYPWSQDTLQDCYVEFRSDKPNTLVSMTLTGEGYFISNHAQEITVDTDSQGIVRVNISSEIAGTNQITITDKDGDKYDVSLTAYNLKTYSTPWFERVKYAGSDSNTHTFYAHIDVENGHYLLKTSSGTITFGGQDYGSIVYDYEIIHGATQHFDVRAMGGFTLSLCDLNGTVICACSL